VASFQSSEVSGRPALVADAHALVAAALGACDCWGTDDGCPTCGGDGSAGWVEPDAELFRLFVGPAFARMNAATAAAPAASADRTDRGPRRAPHDRDAKG
jgi:hypothetical protein